MNAARFAAAVLLGMAAATAGADVQEIRGRTGLPTVKVGAQKVWIESAVVTMTLHGSEVQITEEFKLHYPGVNLEKRPQRITMGVREDFYQKRDKGTPNLKPAEGKGFISFAALVDRRRVQYGTDPWKVNDKGDTLTRWRYWDVDFSPDQRHTVRVTTLSRLGWMGKKRYLEFITKDLGHWRGDPDLVEVKVKAGGKIEANVVGLEPKPTDISAGGIRWVWRKAGQHRNILVILPPNYPRSAG